MYLAILPFPTKKYYISRLFFWKFVGFVKDGADHTQTSNNPHNADDNSLLSHDFNDHDGINQDHSLDDPDNSNFSRRRRVRKYLFIYLKPYRNRRNLCGNVF